jgi:hypothetical protein
MTFKNKRIKIDMPHDFFFDNTVKKLSGDSILFKKETNDYELKPYLQKITKNLFDQKISKLRNHKNYYNEDKVRFLDISVFDKKVEIIVQKVTYEDYVRTNLLLEENYGGRKVRSLVQNVSDLANPVGMELMVLSSDNKLIFQKRSDKVDSEKGKYCSSASGSLRFTDLPEKKCFSLDEVDIFKEVIEELNLEAVDFYKYNFLGISYNLNNGNKPEMHFLFESKLEAAEIINRAHLSIDSWEFSELFMIDVENELLTFLMKQNDFIAIDTNACLRFVRKHLDI